jgi:TolB protein
MRDDATCLTQVTHADTPALFATWSPAGAIAYTTYRDGAMRIYVRDLTSATERLLDVGTLSATSPAFSPDGSLVAFEGYEAGVANVSDVYVVAATGGVPTKVTTGQRYSAGPAWSPDGSTIYFVSNRVSGYNVWGVPVGGGTETMLAGTSGILGRPTVSPGGTEIAYALAVSGASVSEVVVQTLSTGATRTLSTQADAEPSFDANGTGVVVTSQRGGNPELLLLDAATGSVLRHLTTDPAVDGLAAFGPFP